MIYENENIPAETIPHYMWMQCEDGSGSLHNENQDIVVEYDMVLRQYRMYIGRNQNWRDIPGGYMLKLFKAFAEEEVRLIIGNPS